MAIWMMNEGKLCIDFICGELFCIHLYWFWYSEKHATGNKSLFPNVLEILWVKLKYVYSQSDHRDKCLSWTYEVKFPVKMLLKTKHCEIKIKMEQLLGLA